MMVDLANWVPNSHLHSIDTNNSQQNMMAEAEAILKQSKSHRAKRELLTRRADLLMSNKSNY